MRDIFLWIRTPKHDNSFRLPPSQLEVPISDPFEERLPLGLNPVGRRARPPIARPGHSDLDRYV